MSKMRDFVLIFAKISLPGTETMARRVSSRYISAALTGEKNVFLKGKRITVEYAA
jgi:hypothetical protein